MTGDGARRILVAALVLGAFVAGCEQSRAPSTAVTPVERALFGPDMSGWSFVTGGRQEPPGSTFTLSGDVLTISGQPQGYLVSEQEYGDFELRYEWRFATAAGGNSGLLVHIGSTTHAGDWPACIEVQGMLSEHGATFPIGGASGSFTSDKDVIRRVVRPEEWNSTEVVSRGGAFTVKVNGVEVSRGSGNLRRGRLGWQSEGAQLSVRQARIRA